MQYMYTLPHIHPHPSIQVPWDDDPVAGFVKLKCLTEVHALKCEMQWMFRTFWFILKLLLICLSLNFHVSHDSWCKELKPKLGRLISQIWRLVQKQFAWKYQQKQYAGSTTPHYVQFSNFRWTHMQSFTITHVSMASCLSRPISMSFFTNWFLSIFKIVFFFDTANLAVN